MVGERQRGSMRRSVRRELALEVFSGWLRMRARGTSEEAVGASLAS